jgi:hypothetical protein
MPRFSALIITTIGLVCFSISAQAGMNPFKKTKNYKFENDVSWYSKENSAVKSGSVKDGSDTLNYHLNISKDRLRLRLGKNDPSGELENTIGLDKLAIVDVLVDGRRFSLFDWCLSNQDRPGKKLKQGAIVSNDACVNAGGGDFTMALDKTGRNLLKTAQKIEFIVEPFNRPVKLIYTMTGYAAIMSEIDKPVPPPVVKKEAPKVVAKPKPKSKPKARAKSKKVVKMCFAKAPADFSSAVKSVAYPCENKAKKASAEKNVASKVKKEKQKMSAELARIKQEEDARKKASSSDKREMEWAKKQTEIWVKRCEKHWSKGVSPCFCEKYMDQAPSGVINTCGR